MTADYHREFKDRLYAQFARIGKALGSPHRLELLELLAQGERTGQALGTETGLSVAEPTVCEGCKGVRTGAERRLAGLGRLVREDLGEPWDPKRVPMEELIER